MSHGKLRLEKDCLNCGHKVELRYCPNCGQENVQTRQPFHFLFTHFVEDFTHYDGQFWGTIKNLLFKPGKLTNTYLEGKRQKFVPPVKLYIFVSFITFFLFAFFPPINLGDTVKVTNDSKEVAAAKQVILQEAWKSLQTNGQTAEADSAFAKKMDSISNNIVKTEDLRFDWKDLLKANQEIDKDAAFMGFKTQAEYDKGNKSAKWINDAVAKKFFELKEQGVKRGEIYKNLLETSFHNLPKALFIYLPIFAFLMWIFHSKKKWWYFDHGIFTLHYFSFLLISILISGLLLKVNVSFGNPGVLHSFLIVLMMILTFYSFIYFFIAHHRVYKSHGIVSMLIGFVLLFCNYMLFVFLLIGLVLVSFVTMH